MGATKGGRRFGQQGLLSSDERPRDRVGCCCRPRGRPPGQASPARPTPASSSLTCAPRAPIPKSKQDARPRRTSSQSPFTTWTSGAIDWRYSCVSASQTLPVHRIDWILPGSVGRRRLGDGEAMVGERGWVEGGRRRERERRGGGRSGGTRSRPRNERWSSWQTSERRCERTSDSQKRQEVTVPVVVQRRAVRATGTRADGRGGPGRGRRGRSASAGRPGGDGAWSADVASGEEGTADKEGGGEGKITRAWSAPELSAGSSPKTARQHDAPGTCPRERRIAKLFSLQVQGSTGDGRRKRRTSRRLNFAGRSVARVGMCRSPRIRTSMAAVRDADDGGRGRRGGRGGLRRGGPGEGSVSERSELLKTLC